MIVMNENTAGLTIKVVAERTGVSVHTLRAWERRYGVPSPNRNENNRYRLYDEADIADVLFIKQEIDKGVAPAQASLMLRLRLAQSAHAAEGQSGQPTATAQTALLDAFAQSDEMTARQVLDEAFAVLAPEQVALHVIEPTMNEIGERWMRGEMTVWQEHMASNVVQQKLGAVLQAQPALPPTAPLLAAACAPLEEHQLGLITLALVARRQGWRVAYLGQGTPLDAIAGLERAYKPNIIAVSVTTVLGLTGLIPWLDPLNRPAAPLVFGGRIPKLLPAVRAHLPGEYIEGDTLNAVRNLASIRARAEYWVPSKRARNAVEVLQAQRLGIAADAAVKFIATLPKANRQWDTAQVNYATLFLIDSLACALAFDAPELIDMQRHWLADAMSPRLVTQPLIAQHLKVFARVLSEAIAKEAMRLFEPLIERMKNTNLGVQSRTPANEGGGSATRGLK